MKIKILSATVCLCLILSLASGVTLGAETQEGPAEGTPVSCQEGCSLAEGHSGACELYDAGWQDAEGGAWQYGPLAAALHSVQPGGTVKLLKDFYITGQTGIPSITKPMTLTSADPEHPCKLTCAIDGHPTLLIIASDACLKDILIDGGAEAGLRAIGPLVLVQNGNLTLGEGASIRNNRNVNNSRGNNWLGGGVFLYGTMTMEPGSSIQNCSAWAGGGVAVVNSGDSCLTMKGGSIETCESYQGGGVCIFHGSFQLEDGEVKNCRAVTPPETIPIADTDINSPGEGGGVFLAWANCSMEMSGGSLTGNSARYGGGVGCDAGTLTVSGGTVTGNYAEKYGGGILASPGLKIFLSGKFVIADNESGNEGYENLYLDGSEDWDETDPGATATTPFVVTGPMQTDINLGLSRWMHPIKDDPARAYRIVAVPGEGYVITQADRAHFISDDPKYVVRLIEEDGVAKLALTFPTVTYRDGLNGEIFPEETYTCTGGDDTPGFLGETNREGWAFKGWDPEWAPTVTEDSVYTAQWEPLYTITYEDGVGGEAFDTQVTSGLPEGTDTPAFLGTPQREGYLFLGWSLTVADKVTGNAVYTAQWAPQPVDPPNEPSYDDDDDDDDPPVRPTPKPTPTPNPSPTAAPSPEPTSEPLPIPSETPPPTQVPPTQTPQPTPAPTQPPEPDPAPEATPKPSPDPVPKTGDPTHTAVWGLCALGALVGIILTLRPGRKRR